MAIVFFRSEMLTFKRGKSSYEEIHYELLLKKVKNNESITQKAMPFGSLLKDI